MIKMSPTSSFLRGYTQDLDKTDEAIASSASVVATAMHPIKCHMHYRGINCPGTFQSYISVHLAIL